TGQGAGCAVCGRQRSDVARCARPEGEGAGMTPPPIRANVVAAVAAVCANILLVFVSYRLVIAGGGLEALGAWSAIVACVSLLRIGDPGMASAVMRFVALGTADSTGRVSGYVQT